MTYRWWTCGRCGGLGMVCRLVESTAGLKEERRVCDQCHGYGGSLDEEPPTYQVQIDSRSGRPWETVHGQ